MLKPQNKFISARSVIQKPFLAVVMVLAVVSGTAFVMFSRAAAPVGDLNGDNTVNVFDLSILLSNWGKTGVADLNSDGTVNIFDLSTLLSHWGQTGTPTPTQTPTPTRTPTPSPTPTSSPTPGPGQTLHCAPNPHLCGFPDATNTGVPAGTTLAAYTGSMRITTDNTVIDGKLINANTGSGYNDTLLICAKNVVIKNSKFTNGGTNQVSMDDSCSTASITIQDSEFAPSAPPDAAIRGQHWTILRSNLHGFLDGIHPDGDSTFQDSYLHDFINPPAGAHLDASQSLGGTVNNHFIHNTILLGINHDVAGVIQYGTEYGGNTGGIVQNNLLAGGSIVLYCGDKAPDSSGNVVSSFISVTGNHFSKIYAPTYGFNGLSNHCTGSDVTWSGNIDDDSGAALTP